MTGNLGKSALLSLLLVVTSTAALGGNTVYRWKDSAGNTLHSDRPPPAGTKYDTITTNAGYNQSVDGDRASAPEPGKNKASGAQADNTSAAGTTAAPKDEAYCNSARQNLETLNSAARIRIMGDNGEYRYLDEAEKNIEKEKARSIIESHCEN